MATGLVGISKAILTSKDVDINSLTKVGESLYTRSGPVLSYTCPGANIKYAILTVSISLSITAPVLNGVYPNVFFKAEAGNLILEALPVDKSQSNASNLSEHLTQTFNVIVGPNEVWNSKTMATGYILTSEPLSRIQSTMTVSVLEVPV